MHFHTIHQFLAYYERIRARTRRVIDCIPADRIDWSSAPDKWTFADLIRHLAATERFMFVENAMRRPSRYPGHGPELARTHAAVLRYLDDRHAESVEMLSTLGDEDLQQQCETPGGTLITVWKWLRAMVEHEVHHRGQIYLLLGMLGVATPPLYGLTSEEVRERSE